MQQNVANNNIQQATLIRLPVVQQRTGLSRSTIYQLVKDKVLPKPVRLGKRASAWVSCEIDSYIAHAISARDQEAV